MCSTNTEVFTTYNTGIFCVHTPHECLLGGMVGLVDMEGGIYNIKDFFKKKNAISMGTKFSEIFKIFDKIDKVEN